MTMPDSGLVMTEAASLNVMRLMTVAPLFCMEAGLGLPARFWAVWLLRVGAIFGAAPVPVVL